MCAPECTNSSTLQTHNSVGHANNARTHTHTHTHTDQHNIFPIFSSAHTRKKPKHNSSKSRHTHNRAVSSYYTQLCAKPILQLCADFGPTARTAYVCSPVRVAREVHHNPAAAVSRSGQRLCRPIALFSGVRRTLGVLWNFPASLSEFANSAPVRTSIHMCM